MTNDTLVPTTPPIKQPSLINDRDILNLRDYGSSISLTDTPANYRNPKHKKMHYRKISKDKYVDTDTGEVKKYQHNVKKTQASFNKSFSNLSDKICANFTGEDNELFVTLTFDGLAMTMDGLDSIGDFKFTKDMKHNKQVATYAKSKLKAFFQRLNRKFNKGNCKLIHIVIMEPQGNGVPHYHVLLKLLNATTFKLSTMELERLWKQGEVNVESLKNITSLPAYFHVHLTDVPVEDASNQDKEDHEVVRRAVNGKEKSFLKGARLQYFPHDINYFSTSKGLKVGKKSQVLGKQAREMIRERNLELSYREQYTSFSDSDGNEYSTTRMNWSTPAPT